MLNVEAFYKYIIVGDGLAGASAVEGIRNYDSRGSVALFGKEEPIPYHRPPLTKGLWSGKDKLENLAVKPLQYYAQAGVQGYWNTEIIKIDPQERLLVDQQGRHYRYKKLLLATGGSPRQLENDGGCVQYYRRLHDYENLRHACEAGRDFIVIGGRAILPRNWRLA